MRLAIIASFVAAIGAAPLFAADAPPGQGGWQRPTPQQMAAHRAEMDAKRSADVALLLGLRADQKPALDAFLATMRPHGPHDGFGGPGRDHKPGDMPPQNESMIASLDRMSQHIDARDAEAKQRIEATKRFYASLTPEQQQRAEAMMRLMHDHPGHGGGHGPHGAMGGPDSHEPGPPPMGG
jgi:hypothetical protein